MLVERRGFLRTIGAAGVFVIAPALVSACSEAPREEEQPVPPLEEWPTITVPSEIPPDGLFTIESAEHYQHPKIGLKGLHLYWKELYPIVVITSDWEVENLKRVYLNPQTRGRAGLQPINNPFFPDISLAQTSLSTDNISKQTASELGLEAVSLTSKLFENRYPKDSMGVLAAVQTRPTDGRDYALVFGEGYVDHKRRPSPLSFLAVRFQFERSQKPIQPI